MVSGVSDSEVTAQGHSPATGAASNCFHCGLPLPADLDLRLDIDGNLIDATGNQILGDGGPINLPPSSSITIGSDGVISYVPIGETALGRVTQGRISLVNPDPATLSKGLDGHIRAEAGANLEPSADVQLSVGALETSNVNSIAAMVQMIELARSFEGHVQTMKSADELDGSSASLMRLE